MAVIKFILQSKSNPANIYVRLIDGRKIDVKCKTNFVIDPNDWSKTKQRPKSLTNINFKNLDTDLQNLRTNLLNYYNKSNQSIDLVWLKNFINPPIINEIPKTLVGYFDYYTEQRGAEITHRTKLKIEVVKNKIIKYEKQIKKTIFLKDVNIDFKNQFQKYNIDNGYAENTFYNNLKEIKAICRHAAKKGLEISNEVSDFKIVQKKAESIYLSEDELKIIENTSDHKFYNENLKATRDWLLISCYSAQRVSDFMKFKSSMIREQVDRNGKIVKLIEFTQKKTNTKTAIPLHHKILKILESRNGEFPTELNAKSYNEYLKTVARIAKINNIVFGGKNDPKTNRKIYGDFPKYELVTSHIGRRSFATNHYGKMPTALIKQMTGHKTEAMLLVYIGKTETESALQANEWF